MLKKLPFARKVVLVVAGLLVLAMPLMTHCAYATKDASTPTIAQASKLTMEKYALDNGLEIVVIPIKRAPVVYHSLWYRVGSGDSPEEKTGVAHFLEHLMFKGTNKFPKDSFDKLIYEFGGSQNAQTHWDYTVYHVTAAKEHLDKIMELEADRMRNLSFTEKEVETEKGVVLQERMMRVDANPGAWLNEAVNAQFFKVHPYKAPIIGYESHIESYTYKDARAFYDKWYHPNNAILVVAGDVTPKEVHALAKKYFGAMPSQTLPDNTRLREPKSYGVTAKLELHHPDTGRFFQRCYPLGNLKTLGHKKTAAYELLSQVLGDDNHGIFVDILVGDYKPYAAINASYTHSMRDDYAFNITASYKNEYEIEKIEGLLDAEIARFIRDGMPKEKLDLIKQNLMLSLSFEQDSLSGMAQFIGMFLANGYQIEDFQQAIKVIDETTVEDLQLAAKELFAKPPATVAYAYPKQEK